MARAAVLGRLTWRPARVAALRSENPRARTLRLEVRDWPGHDAGQHVDLRLTAANGYTAVRSYSLAAPAEGDHVEITVEEVSDGEVSSYLVDEVREGDQLEVRGPLGGWFVWRPEQTEPVQLVAGGSGLVPLMSMVRARALASAAAPMRLLYSVRSPDAVLYGPDLAELTGPPPMAELSIVYTRVAPADWPTPPRRIDAATIAQLTLPPGRVPTCYVCGPTSFVEKVAELLVDAGHDPARIRTERFGGTGGAG